MINKKMANQLLSIIVPFFDEQKIIRLFYKELVKNLVADYNYQIIFVNDGSTDKGFDIIKRIAREDSRIKYLSLQKNYGQQAAIYTGLRFARSRAVIVMDCDLQDPPSLIPKMVKAWEDGAKIVLPLRQCRQDHWRKKVSAAAFYTIFNLCRKSKLNPAVGEFYLLDISARSELLHKVTMPLFLRGTVQHLSYKKQFLPYIRGPRFAGQSGFSFLKMLRLARDAFYSRAKVRSTKNVAQAFLSAVARRFGGAEVEACSSKPINSYLIQESNIFEGKTAAIVGAGISGLTLALYLGRLGVKVSIYEKDSKVGGLMTSELIHGQKYDRYYHHIFKKDSNFLELINSLGLSSKLHWHTSRVGALFGNRLYAMNNIIDLLHLPVMSIGAKLRMLSGSIRLSKTIAFTKTDTAESMISKDLGQVAWSAFWRSMFESKFGLFSRQISAAWFQARLKARATSRRYGREILGYPDSGFDTIAKALKKEIIARGGKIFTGIEVDNIATKNQQFTLSFSPTSLFSKSSLSSSSFDLCISTLPPYLTSKIFSAYKSPPIEYLGFVGVIVVLDKSFSSHYWINVLGRDTPFGVIVEQNNLVPPFPSSHSLSSRLKVAAATEMEGSLYKNHILYLGKYIDTTSEFYNLPDETIAKIASGWLEQIKTGAKNDIVEIKIFRDPRAQPVVTTKYKKPPHVCDIDGFYSTSMAHIFPADRGLNEAVKEAKKIVQLITNQD